MRDYIARRGCKTALEVQDVGLGASLRPKREKLLGFWLPVSEFRQASDRKLPSFLLP